MKRILLILLCLGLVGCASVAGNKGLERQLAKPSKSLPDKDEYIKELQGQLEEKERQLKDKDLEIEQLRKKLETFGIFE